MLEQINFLDLVKICFQFRQEKITLKYLLALCYLDFVKRYPFLSRKLMNQGYMKERRVLFKTNVQMKKQKPV